MALVTSQVAEPPIPTIGCSEQSVCHSSLKTPRVRLLLEAFPDCHSSLIIPLVSQPRPEAPPAYPSAPRLWQEVSGPLFTYPGGEQDRVKASEALPLAPGIFEAHFYRSVW